MKPQKVVAKVLIVQNGQVLILRRSAGDNYRAGQYDIPGGKIDEGETIVEGLVREINEEVGLDVDMNSLSEILNFGAESNDQNVEKHVYLCKMDGSQSPTIKLSHEHEAYFWLSIEDGIAKFKHPFYGVALDFVNRSGLL